MASRTLKNKPLIEAIFEIRWDIQPQSEGIVVDPHYHLLPGRLHERLQAKYPHHERLPTADFPAMMTAHVVQHRFRSHENGWPLVQLGPGVFTVNDTEKYSWESFRTHVVEARSQLYDAYPKASDLRVVNLTLRYIDAIEFDYLASSVLDFIRDKLKVSYSLPSDMFNKTGVEPVPNYFQSHLMFRSGNPKGDIHIRFATGQRHDKPAIIWETTIQTNEEDLPNLPSGFEAWLDQAHELANNWFFKLIEGDLRKQFSGD